MNEVIGIEFKWLQGIRKCCDGEIPPIFGWIFPGFLGLSINSVDYLEGIYVHSNKYHTKHPHSQKGYS